MHFLPKRHFFFALCFLPARLNSTLALFGGLSVLCSLFFVPLAHAQSPQDVFYPSVESLNQNKRELRDQARDGKVRVNGQEVNNYQLTSIFYNLTNMIGCTDINSCNPKHTALGSITELIGMMYAHPPASGIAYVHDILTHAGLATPAYAQGIGFAGMAPLLPLWQTTLHIAYSIITVIMGAIGFMVIFRMHIDPKTIISVQAAIPKIVLTLILITLSYPIVGFMIDLMYLVMALIIAVIAQGAGQSAHIAELQTRFMTANWMQLGSTVFSGGYSSLWHLFGQNVDKLGIGEIISIITTLVVTQFNPVTGTVAFFGLGTLPLIILTILFLGLLFTFIRLSLLLLNSYIQLLIALILGPLQLLTEAIPGRSAFSEWILNVIANLVVFPATVAVLMFAEYLTNPTTPTSVGLFAPPFVGVPRGSGGFPAFLGLGVMFLAPTLVAQIKKVFHPKPILPVTAGTAFAPLTGAVQTSMGAASQFYYFGQTAQMIPFVKNLIPGGPGGTKH